MKPGLRNQQREHILRLVREHDGAVDAAELAEQTGLHVTTVRFHLDGLCGDGSLMRTRMHRPGAGRPRTGYVAVADRFDYRVLAEVLAMELGNTAEARAQRAERAGRRWVAQQAPDGIAPHADQLEGTAQRATETFRRMGFAPQLVSSGTGAETSGTAETSRREQTIRLHACPVRELARAHPEVGCGVHPGMLNELLAEASADTPVPAMSGYLEPFVEPELCVARLAAR